MVLLTNILYLKGKENNYDIDLFNELLELKNKKNNKHDLLDFNTKYILSIEKALKKHILHLVKKEVAKLKKK